MLRFSWIVVAVGFLGFGTGACSSGNNSPAKSDGGGPDAGSGGRMSSGGSTGMAGAGGTASGGSSGSGSGGAGGTASGGAGHGGSGTGGSGTGGSHSGGASAIGGSSGGGGGGSAGNAGGSAGNAGASGGGVTGQGGAGGGSVTYLGCSFIGGVNRVVIAKRDTARDLCVKLVLNSPGTNPLGLTLPPNLGTEYAYASAGVGDCLQRRPPSGAASAVAGTGSVVASATSQPTYTVDVTLTFAPDAIAGLGTSERLMASNVVASAECP